MAEGGRRDWKGMVATREGGKLAKYDRQSAKPQEDTAHLGLRPEGGFIGAKGQFCIDVSATVMARDRHAGRQLIRIRESRGPLFGICVAEARG